MLPFWLTLLGVGVGTAVGLAAAAALGENEAIAFNAGSHTEVIKLAYKDFERLAKPKVVSFTT